MKIFNRQRYFMNQQRAARLLGQHDFLMREIEGNIGDRLSLVMRDFPSALIVGGRVSADMLTFLSSNKSAQKIDVICFAPAQKLRLQELAAAQEIKCELSFIDMPENEVLPVAAASYDLVIEAGQAHHINDLPGWLVQMRLALKPDGLFMGAMAGGNTLQQLKHSLIAVETEKFGGAGPRIAPFAPLQSVAGLMQRAGFSLPVVDHDLVPVYYRKLETLLYDLRGMGEGSCLDKPLHSYRGKGFFTDVEAFYKNSFAHSDGTLRADFEIIFMHGWSPHETQQKPLRPGQGQTSLSEVL